MKHYRLFLDDIRQPQKVSNYIYPIKLRKEFLHKWVIVRTYDEFINYIKENGIPTHISFDHDLADIRYDYKTQKESFNYHAETGYDAAKWLCEYLYKNDEPLPICYVHSENVVGKRNIKKLLKSFKDGTKNRTR